MRTLFDSMNIAGLTARNRLVRAASYERMASPDGSATNKLVALYAQLACGGVGTIISSFTSVRLDEWRHSHMLSLHDDALITSHRQLTEAAHAHGALIFSQLVHCGSGANARDGQTAAPGPCSLAAEPGKPASRHMSAEEIGALVQDFAHAAVRAREAGYDGVELHAAHGYLLAQFLTPLTNRRTDAYGGSAAGRARIVAEVIAAIRQAAGGDFPILAKINSSDGRPEGASEDDMLAVALELAEGLDGIEVSGRSWSRLRGRDAAAAHAIYAPFAARLALATDAPVISTGLNRSPKALQDILGGSRIAGFGLARPLICEPDLPKRWQEGRVERARCVSCGRCFSAPQANCAIRSQKEATRK